jgi:hypothetical protein
MTAYIGYENLLESADTVTPSNEATDFEAVNAYDRLTTTWWKPGVLSSPQTETLTISFASAQAVNYFGVMGHNLGTEGITIKLQYSTASPISWVTLFTISPTDNLCLFRYDVTGATAADWRIELTNCTADTLMAILSFGAALATPSGIRAPFKPVNLNRDKDILNNVSEGGQFAGRSVISDGYKVEIKQAAVDPAWIETNYDALMDWIEVSPFFFSWDYENHLADAAYVWIESVDPPEYTHQGALYMAFTFQCKGLIE